MDLIGPLPTTEEGNKYILVFIDALTKWSEAVPIVKTDSGIIAKHLYEHIICRHGTPENIITDSAKKFTATVLTEVCKILRINKIPPAKLIKSTRLLALTLIPQQPLDYLS